MIIESFDNKALELLRKEIDAALEPIKTKYGLKKLKTGALSYYPDRLKFHVKVESEIDASVSPEASEKLRAKNEQTSKILGFTHNIIGESFMNGGNEFTVVELKPERPKWPIIANKKGTDGMYKFQATKTIKWLNKEISYKYDF